MNDDYMFEDEIDEEAAAELEKERAKQAESETQNTQQNTYSDQTNGQTNTSGSYTYNNFQSNPGGPNNNNNSNYSQKGYYTGYQYQSYNQQNPGGKRHGTGPATASLVLGIISLVFFCSCLNVVTGVIAIILGATYLANYDLKEGKIRAIVGIVTASISILMLAGGYMMISNNADNIVNFLDDDYFRYYYNYDNGGDYEEFFNDGDFLRDYLNENEIDDTF